MPTRLHENGQAGRHPCFIQDSASFSLFHNLFLSVFGSSSAVSLGRRFSLVLANAGFFVMAFLCRIKDRDLPSIIVARLRSASGSKTRTDQVYIHRTTSLAIYKKNFADSDDRELKRRGAKLPPSNIALVSSDQDCACTGGQSSTPFINP